MAVFGHTSEFIEECESCDIIAKPAAPKFPLTAFPEYWDASRGILRYGRYGAAGRNLKLSRDFRFKESVTSVAECDPRPDRVNHLEKTGITVFCMKIHVYVPMGFDTDETTARESDLGKICRANRSADI